MDNLILDALLFSPWIKRDISMWDEIIKDYSPVFYKKNCVLIEQQEVSSNVFIIKNGRIRIAVSNSEGYEKHIFIAEEGCVIGEESCILDIPSSTAASTIIATTVYKIPKQHFIKSIYEDINLNKKIMSLMATKNNILIDEITNLSFSRIIKRVASGLLNLVRQYGVKTEYGYKINIKFTHQDIANLTNSSRVMISNIFRQLSKEGIVKKIDGYMTVTDIEKLNTNYINHFGI